MLLYFESVIKDKVFFHKTTSNIKKSENHFFIPKVTNKEVSRSGSTLTQPVICHYFMLYKKNLLVVDHLFLTRLYNFVTPISYPFLGLQPQNNNVAEIIRANDKALTHKTHKKIFYFGRSNHKTNIK